MGAKLFAVLRGLVYATGFYALWWWVVVSARPLDRRLGLALPEWTRLPGLVLMVVGAALALWCIGAFAFVGRGTPAPFDAPREFVAVGPYLFVRNPMYLGALLVLVGVALYLGWPSALLVAAAFLLLTHLFVLLYEEPTLERRFGTSYREYRSRVRRWLPRAPAAR